MKKLLAIVLSLVLLLSSGCIFNSSMPVDTLHVYYIDVGQADCTLIALNGKHMLIDGGNSADANTIISFIRSLAITTIDIVIATHPHEDHIGGLSTVIDSFDVKAVYSPVNSYDSHLFEELSDAANRQCGMAILRAGMHLNLGDAKIDVLSPQSVDTGNPNNTSIVLKLTYGKTSFMFMGDAETEIESDILDSGFNVKADVLKVGHHGASTSTSYYFLRSVNPQVAIISCGKNNNYGHPHKETIEKLTQAEVDIYRTDEMGTVLATSNGTNVVFEKTVTPAPFYDEYYVGNVNSKKFHLPTCGGLPQEKNRKIFYSRQDAVDSGYAPCGICKP